MEVISKENPYELFFRGTADSSGSCLVVVHREFW